MTATLLAAMCASVLTAGDTQPSFSVARPVWPVAGRSEMNQFVGFRAVIDASSSGDAVLRITASSLYRVHLDGRFVGHGPARGPHGHFRVDEWRLAGGLKPGPRVVAVEVAANNIDSYYIPNNPPFLQAEILMGGQVLAATGDAKRGFEAFPLEERVRKVQRYSKQRTFSEAYRLKPGFDGWRIDPSVRPPAVECEVLAPVPLLPRRIPPSDFAVRQPAWTVSWGKMKTDVPPPDDKTIRDFLAMGLLRGGFPVEQLEAKPVLDLARAATGESMPIGLPYSCDTPLSLDTAANAFALLDLGTNLTGFIGAHVVCKKPARLYLTFDEILTNGDVDFRRLYCANVVYYELQPGWYRIESFEPYTLRYLKLIVLEGQCEISEVHLREYANPDVWQASFAASDDRLNRLFAAGRETFRQNAVDIFVDCPSRERAGWLCDSFFTSRVAIDLSGRPTVERNFLENYLIPERFKDQPEGMLAMCYPADHRPNSFIPNWALWLVVELDEYLKRSGDRETVDAFRPKVLKLFDYFKRFRNESGLLENLESWVFIEWSAANQFVQNVSYPSNMLYAGALEAAGRMYGMPELLAEAGRIRATIMEQSFDGQFFVDNAVRKDGKLQVTHNHTETCQYYAFYFGIASPQTHGPLWKLLSEQFGPKRKETKAFPDVPVSNAFIGNVLRLELLSRYGQCRQLLDESIDYHLYMADRTGTLWENVHPGASCNHGFASHLVHLLYRDVLGLFQVDPPNKAVHVRLYDQPLQWCEGRIPLPDGGVSLRWWREGDRLAYHISMPAGYRLQLSNFTGKDLLPRP
jgi:alpha-L-rhamnosidase